MPGDKLEFTKQEPAFLRKLREQHGGPRNNVQAPRPKKDRLRTGEDDEDEPVIVDESGENVAKEEWEGMLKREKEGVESGEPMGVPGEGALDEAGGKESDPSKREAQKGAEIGGNKKRKVGKIIADDGASHGTSGKSNDETPPTKSQASTAKVQDKTFPEKPKKKAKKVKLSFDE